MALGAQGSERRNERGGETQGGASVAASRGSRSAVPSEHKDNQTHNVPLDKHLLHLPEPLPIRRSLVDLSQRDVHKVVTFHQMAVERDAVFQLDKLAVSLGTGVCAGGVPGIMRGEGRVEAFRPKRRRVNEPWACLVRRSGGIRAAGGQLQLEQPTRAPLTMMCGSEGKVGKARKRTTIDDLNHTRHQ